jgi:N-carbamoyl-L-amino-acid hydrolase
VRQADRREAGLAAGAKLARKLFAEIATATADPPGVTRVSYGEGERTAFALVARAAEAYGARVAFDAAGNQFLSIGGRDRSRTIYVGSHLDTVPHGGNFDGAAGVLAGVALQATLVELGVTPPFDLTVLCLRAEESCWFPDSYIGSKTALGRLDPALLDTLRRSDSGRTLAEHMREEGFDPDGVRRGTRRIDPAKAVAYIEPHIEQGPVLLAKGVPVGLVTGIRGSFRFRDARCVGAYAHSGATPLELRQDAVVATAELVTAMQELYEAMLAEGRDLTVTFGVLGTDPERHSFSAIAGETRFVVDVRSDDLETLADVEARLWALCGIVGAKRRVRFDLGSRSGSDPARMSAALISQVRQAAARIGLEPHEMASGAGHDAATFAAAGIPSGMIFIRNANGSHNPDEAMDLADFDRALAWLLALIDDLAAR